MINFFLDIEPVFDYITQRSNNWNTEGAMANNSIQRAGKIMSLFSEKRPAIGVTEIARELALPKSTAHSLIQGMVKTGMLEKDRVNGKYQMGLKLFAMAFRMISTNELYRVSKEILKRISIDYQLNVRLVIWERDALLAIVECQPNVVSFGPSLYARSFAYCTASGLVLLAYKTVEEQKQYLKRTELKAFSPYTITDPKMLLKKFKEIRKQGWGFSDQATGVGRCAVAAPIYGHDGDVVAALALSGTKEQFEGKTFNLLKETAIETSNAISQDIGYYQ